jgi:hypothetical protein
MYSIPGLPNTDAGVHALVQYTLLQTSGFFVPQLATKRIFIELCAGGWGGAGGGGGGVAGSIGGVTTFGSYIGQPSPINVTGAPSSGSGNGGNGEIIYTPYLAVRGSGNVSGTYGGGGNADGAGGDRRVGDDIFCRV